MLNSFWNWFAIIVTIASILACWWLLHWTKGISDRTDDEVDDTGHIWDHDIRELNNPPATLVVTCLQYHHRFFANLPGSVSGAG